MALSARHCYGIRCSISQICTFLNTYDRLASKGDILSATQLMRFLMGFNFCPTQRCLLKDFHLRLAFKHVLQGQNPF